MNKFNLTKCDYYSHDTNEQNFYYCFNCKRRICSNCLLNHNSKNDYSRHNYILLKDALEKAESKRKEIESSPLITNKNILNFNNNEDTTFINNKINNYRNILNNLINEFRNQFNIYKIQFTEYEKQKNVLIENLAKSNTDPISLIHLSEDYEKTNKIYNDLILKKNYIKLLYDSTNTLLNEQNTNNNNMFNYNKIIEYEKINNNNFNICGDIVSNTQKGVIDTKLNIKIIDKNKIEDQINNPYEQEKGEIIKYNNKIEDESTIKNNENVNIIKNKEINIEKEKEKEKENILKVNEIINNNNINENSKQKENEDLNINNKIIITNENTKKKNENTPKHKFLVLNFINEIKEDDKKFTNKKIKRDENINIEEKDSFLFNQNNKKQRLENHNNSQKFLITNSKINTIEEEKKSNYTYNNNNENHLILRTYKNINGFNNIIINNNNTIIIPNAENKPEKPKYFYGLSIWPKLNANNKDNTNNNNNETRKEIVILVLELKRNEGSIMRHFTSSKITHEKYYLQCSHFPYECSRLININNEAYVFGGRNYKYYQDLGNQYCFKINYINSNKNNGLGEIKCISLKNTNYPHYSHSVLFSRLYNTIFVLSGYNQKKCEYAKLNDKGEIDKWEEMNPIKTPRENPISFLLNDTYIYLIGGKNNEPNNNYDVFDFSRIFSHNMPVWKNCDFTINESNSLLFETKGPGIIESNNDIYIFGGYNGKNQFIAWKICFFDRFIKTIEKYESEAFPSEKIGSFYGQQKFMIFEDYFININVVGKCEAIPRQIFNNNF